MKIIALEMSTRGWVFLGLIGWCVLSIPVGVLVGMMLHDNAGTDEKEIS